MSDKLLEDAKASEVSVDNILAVYDLNGNNQIVFISRNLANSSELQMPKILNGIELNFIGGYGGTK